MHLAMQCILNWGIFKYIQCRWRVINYVKSLPYPAHTHTPNCSSFPHKNRLGPAEDTLRSSGKSTARWQVTNPQVTPFAGVARGWHSLFCRRTRGSKQPKQVIFSLAFREQCRYRVLMQSSLPQTKSDVWVIVESRAAQSHTTCRN